MRLTFAIAFAFTIFPALVSASAVQVASRAQPKKCGTGGKVLAQNTIGHKGSTITYVSGTCPGGISGSGNPTKRSELEERQDVCTNGNCSITCEELSYYDIYVDDCAIVIAYIESYAPYSFTLPAREYAYWTYGTCTVTITNFDYVNYTICYATLAYDAAATVEGCIGITAGGVCDGTQGVGQKWAIEIS